MRRSRAATRTPAVPGSGAAGAGRRRTAQSAVTPVDLTQERRRGTANLPRIVYFDFDSYVVKDEYRPMVEANAKALTADRKRKVAVEGHTDERGGREYNLALGQKRAEAVAKSLTLLGANDGQIEAVSFGKERPAVQGSDEAAWAKNRRAELTPLMMPRIDAPDRAVPALGACLVAALAAPAAHAGLFDDDEARRAILDLRQRIEQSNEQQQRARPSRRADRPSSSTSCSAACST